MFASKAILLKKTGPDGIGRYDFLKQLITEFTTTRNAQPKYQVLANLANFCYDPLNFEHLKQLHATDLFLSQLSETDEQLVHFGLVAICNLSPEPEFKDYIVKLNGIKLITDLLLHTNEEIAVNAITALYFLIFPESPHLITPDLQEKAHLYQTHTNPRFRNLGTVFIENIKSEIKLTGQHRSEIK